MPQHLPGANDRVRRARMMTQLGTMLLRRVRIALRAGLPALQRRLPDAWDVHPDSREVSQGSNLALLFYEIFLNQTAQGPQLTTADAVGRYFVLGIPSRHRQTGKQPSWSSAFSRRIRPVRTRSAGKEWP